MTMNKRKLGRQGLTVSEVGLGCMGFTQSYPPYPDRRASLPLYARRWKNATKLFNITDYNKLKPVLFEMPGYTYLRTGGEISKCLQPGRGYGPNV